MAVKDSSSPGFPQDNTGSAMQERTGLSRDSKSSKMEDFRSYVMSLDIYRQVKKFFAATVTFHLSIVWVRVFPSLWHTVQHKWQLI